MVIISPNPAYHYELERISALFYPLEYHYTEIASPQVGDFLLAEIETCTQEIKVHIQLRREGHFHEVQEKVSLEELRLVSEELVLARFVYGLLSQVTGKSPKWGVLTGIRPVKLIGRALSQGVAFSDLEAAFVEKRCLSVDKFKLAMETHTHEQEILSRSTPDSFSLYVGIPFCPSRCSYCSFVSQAVEQAHKLIQPYVEHLCREIRHTGKIAQELGLKLRTVYIGGGTPTTLTPEQLEMVMYTIGESFPLKSAWEYTVEAGRADTITKEKLQVIQRMGAERISINPQTLNDDVLKEIGRKHSGADTLARFYEAREIGFCNINMDIIAGLPKEDFSSFQNTVDTLALLGPENITVHTLSIKRSASLNDQRAHELLLQADLADKMVDYSQKTLLAQNYIPYYLYRQKNMLGNLENTGFSKRGKEGLYNVYIMDETHTILACGASSVTKIRLPTSKRLERIFNYKFPYEYINRFDEILLRKEKVKALYEADNI